MVRFQIFTVDRGGGKTPKTLIPTGRISGGERFGQAADGSFATKQLAEQASRELRGEFADSETPVGVREILSPESAAAKPRTRAGEEIIGPPPSGRGRQLQRERIERETAEAKGELTRKQKNVEKAKRLATIETQRRSGQITSSEARRLRLQPSVSKEQTRDVSIPALTTLSPTTPEEISPEEQERNRLIKNQLNTGQITAIEAKRLRDNPNLSRGSVRSLRETRGTTLRGATVVPPPPEVVFSKKAFRRAKSQFDFGDGLVRPKPYQPIELPYQAQ